jgi:hypothetical protein
VYDPHAVGAAVGRLNKNAQQSGRVALGILTALLAEGEYVECLVQGRVNDRDGIAALTNTRFLLLNDRQWKPDMLALTVDRSFSVQGWQDDRTAALVITSGDRSVTIDHIVDRPVAIEMAQRLRARAAG